MVQDQLTRAERIRLEALSQANTYFMTKPLVPVEIVLEVAETIEAWLKKADIRGKQ